MPVDPVIGETGPTREHTGKGVWRQIESKSPKPIFGYLQGQTPPMGRKKQDEQPVSVTQGYWSEKGSEK